MNAGYASRSATGRCQRPPDSPAPRRPPRTRGRACRDDARPFRALLRSVWVRGMFESSGIRLFHRRGAQRAPAPGPTPNPPGARSAPLRTSTPRLLTTGTTHTIQKRTPFRRPRVADKRRARQRLHSRPRRLGAAAPQAPSDPRGVRPLADRRRLRLGHRAPRDDLRRLRLSPKLYALAHPSPPPTTRTSLPCSGRPAAGGCSWWGAATSSTTSPASTSGPWTRRPTLGPRRSTVASRTASSRATTGTCWSARAAAAAPPSRFQPRPLPAHTPRPRPPGEGAEPLLRARRDPECLDLQAVLPGRVRSAGGFSTKEKNPSGARRPDSCQTPCSDSARHGTGWASERTGGGGLAGRAARIPG